jgi:plasmid stability protein
MVQIRNVPDAIHRTLKARAARAGMTLSDYLLAEVSWAARRPTLDEIIERIHARASVSVSEGSAKAVRAERQGRHR